jgi:proton-dependent oligopeptide transporter, POT family
VTKTKLPLQALFIIGNEACERFSYYGMRNILTVFLVGNLLVSHIPLEADRGNAAKEVFHLFSFGVYLCPMLGGYLADRVLGKYRTVLWLSLVYCAGHAALAFFDDNRLGFYGGLALIALGSGGIKPCVAAMVGDQFDEQNKTLAKNVFAAFYWSINLGSFFASLFIPLILKSYGPKWAFGIPGILMAIATLIFWAGRKRYVHMPPTPANKDGFLAVMRSAFRHGGLSAVPEAVHSKSAVEAVRAVLRVLLVFAPIPLFWALFDQKASTWVLQARTMDPHVSLGPLQFSFQPSQMQFINPALVMLLIPLLNAVVLPALRRLGFKVTSLRLMTAGMFIAVASWVLAGVIQRQLDLGQQVNILAQFWPYVLLTSAEVLVSSVGLEFAYSQAPQSMKGALMASWTLTVAIGNLGVSQLARFVTLSGAPLFFFWAGAALVAAIALAFIGRRYVETSNYANASV